MLRETTSRGLCGLACPSRISERGGEGDCVKGGGGEGERERERALGLLLCHATALDIEVDPRRRRFGRREADFALQRLVECRALETDRIRMVALRPVEKEDAKTRCACGRMLTLWRGEMF